MRPEAHLLAVTLTLLSGCGDDPPSEPKCSAPDSVAVVLDFQAEWSRVDAMKIAYNHIPHERGETGVVEIWVKDLGTGDARWVTDGEVPRWSPNGKALCFERIDSAGGQIWMIDLASGEETQLTSGLDVGKGHPTWSGDGGSIAYATGLSSGEQPSGIWTLELATGKQTHIIGGLFPDWSPVADEIVFGPPLKVVKLHDGGLEVLSTRSGVLFPRWSPDGTKIAYEAAGSVYVLDRETREDRLLVSQAALPTWSPDGNEIAFWRIDETAGATVLYAVRLDGTGLRQLTFPADYGIACPL